MPQLWVSKLFLLINFVFYFFREILKDSTRSDIAINHIHPGYVDTDMSSHKGPLTLDEGAKSSLFAATLPPNTDIKGQYIWFDCSILDWVNDVTPVKWT